MSKVYLALYKGRKKIQSPKDIIYRVTDWAIRQVGFDRAAQAQSDLRPRDETMARNQRQEIRPVRRFGRQVGFPPSENPPIAE